jgi:hypothetical protein
MKYRRNIKRDTRQYLFCDENCALKDQADNVDQQRCGRGHKKSGTPMPHCCQIIQAVQRPLRFVALLPERMGPLCHCGPRNTSLRFRFDEHCWSKELDANDVSMLGHLNLGLFLTRQKALDNLI